MDYANPEVLQLAKTGGFEFTMQNGLSATLYTLRNPVVSGVRAACENIDVQAYRFSQDDLKDDRYLTLKVALKECNVYLVFSYWTEAWRAVSIFTRHFRQFVKLEWSVNDNLLLAVADGKAYPYRSPGGQAVHQAILMKVSPKIAALIKPVGKAGIRG